MKVYLEIIALCKVREALLEAYRVTALESILRDAWAYEKVIKDSFYKLPQIEQETVDIEACGDYFYVEVVRYCQITLADGLK